MKKKRFNLKTIIAAGIAVAGLAIMLMMYTRLQELTNQLVYLQDTMNIMLSDVGGMQSNIEKTLQEEASMVESYSMEISDMDFVKKTYGVNVSVIPKEYSEKTSVSVYFGTAECPLKLDGYAYTGSVRLPLGKTFQGNVTFLMANGKKKSTEVLEDYDGLGTELSEVLSGQLETAPSWEGDTLSLKSDCSFALAGGKQFQFDTARFVAELDEDEIWEQDLFENMENQKEDNRGNILGGKQPVTETAESGIELPVNSYSSNLMCHFSYDLPQEPEENLPEGENPVEEENEDHKIRLYLQAVSTDGYRFEYDVFQGTYRALEQKLDPDSFDFSPHAVVYDKNGNALKLD